LPKVMIVDDDRTTVTLLQTLLSLDGFDVIIVPRGEEVIPQAQREKPDLFLIDFHLSDISGAEVVAALRRHNLFAHTPIVMASGMNVEPEAKKAGANMFLVKPYEPGNLAAIFHKLLGTA
jgi:CheY-like chemotaxis protein